MPNSAAYLKLENMRAIDYTNDPNFRIFISLGDGIDSSLPQGWAVGRANQDDTISSEYSSTLSFGNDDAVAIIQIPQPRQYRSVTLILAPASWRREPFSSIDWETSFGYLTNELLVDSLVDTLVPTSCCDGMRGDLNSDGDDANILDLTYLVDFIFRGGTVSYCPLEADLNSDGITSNILDLTFIVDFIFRGSGLSPGPC